jgi:hypothetical protein
MRTEFESKIPSKTNKKNNQYPRTGGDVERCRAVMTDDPWYDWSN